ncbi:MAG: tetratricopeptide repeat protein [Kiloniellaceae bacterium]
MKPTHFGKRPIQIAAALGVLLVAASCTNMAVENARSAGPLPSRLDGGVGQLVRYCEKLRDAGSLATAAAMCERAHRLDPTDPAPLMGLAGIFLQTGELNQAVQAYRTILAISPDHVEARYELGKTYIALKQYESALTEFQTALRYKADDPRLYNALGVSNGLLGAHTSALADFQAGLKVAPGHVPLRNNLGLSLVMNGRYDEGLKLLEAVVADPKANDASRENLQLAQGLASTARAEAMLAAAEFDAESLEDDGGAESGLPAADETEEADMGADVIPDVVPDVVPDVDVDEDEVADAETPADGGWMEQVAQAEVDRSGPSGPAGPTLLTGAFVPPEPIGQEADRTIPDEIASPSGPFADHKAPVRPAPPVDPIVEAEPDSPTPIFQTARASVPDISDVEMPSASFPESLTADADVESLALDPTLPAEEGSAHDGGGEFAIQFASYSSEERARRGWDTLKADANDLLGDIEPVIHRADLGPGQGVFYRLRTPPRTQAKADGLCRALEERGMDCLVVRLAPKVAEEGAEDRAAPL